MVVMTFLPMAVAIAMEKFYADMEKFTEDIQIKYGVSQDQCSMQFRDIPGLH